MTRFDGNHESIEAFANPGISQVTRTFSSKKKFFCLPSFAACTEVLHTVCAAARVAVEISEVRCDNNNNPAINNSSLRSTAPNTAGFTNTGFTKTETNSCTVIDAAKIPPEVKNPRRNRKRGRGKPTPSYKGINYGSVSEAALGILLEELIPNFSVREGHTFQLPLGGGRTVDFLIENTLVEFHFPRSFSRGNDLGDFKSKKERRDFLRALKRVGRNRHQRKKLLRATHELLIQNYVSKRRKQIDMSVYGPHTELIVASTPEEFFQKVICRFVGWDIISENAFVERFGQCCRSVINSSRESWKEAA